MKINTYNVTYNSKVVLEGNKCTVQDGTGTQLYLEYGNEGFNQVFKRVLDCDKNIIGEFYNQKQTGYIGDQKFISLDKWMEEINNTTSCNVF